MDEGYGHHDARTGHGNAGSNTRRLSAFDGAEHDLSSHRNGWTTGIPRHAFCQRYLASGSLGRKSPRRPLGIVHFSTKVAMDCSSLQIQWTASLQSVRPVRSPWKEN